MKFNLLPNFFKFDKKFTNEVIAAFETSEFLKIHETRRIDEKGKEYIDGLIFEKENSLYIFDREYLEEDEEFLLSLTIYYKDFKDVQDNVEKIKKYIKTTQESQAGEKLTKIN